MQILERTILACYSGSLVTEIQLSTNELKAILFVYATTKRKLILIELMEWSSFENTDLSVVSKILCVS